MADFTYPATLPSPSYPFASRTQDPVLRDDFDNGVAQTRAKFTKMRSSWTLQYPALTSEQRDTLYDFWKSVKGGSEIFEWTNPEDNVAYDCRFISYSEAKRDYKYYSVNVEIEEV